MPPKFDPGCTRALSAGQVYYCRVFFPYLKPGPFSPFRNPERPCGLRY
jgi:hypothetical protein